MLNSLDAALYAPQTRPVPPPSHPTQESYERLQMTNWQSDTALTPPMPITSPFSHVHHFEQLPPNRDFARKLRSLQQHYTILDSKHLVIELLGEEPALYALLIEAVRPLRQFFGEGRIIQLRVQVSDDDSIFRAAVQLPANFSDDAELALGTFDAQWWLDNCHRSGGALVFDYEIQDAI